MPAWGFFSFSKPFFSYSRSETNLDEVLQSRNIFSNVSKGELAKADKISRAFPDAADDEAILCEILSRGELQVGEKERELALSKMRREIALVLAGMSVNPVTQLPYPVTMIEKAMKDVHFKPDARKATKQQAKTLLTILSEKMPLERARMRLKMTGETERLDRLAEELQWEEECRAEGERTVLLEPERFRVADERARAEQTTVVILSLAATAANRGRVEDIDQSMRDLVLDEEGSSADSGDPAGNNDKSRKGAKKASSAAAKGGQSSSASQDADSKTSKQMTKREQKGQMRDQMLGVIDDDSDDDWKNQKGGGGKKKGGKKKGRK